MAESADVIIKAKAMVQGERDGFMFKILWFMSVLRHQRVMLYWFLEWLDFFEFLDGFSIEYKEVDDEAERLREKTSKFQELLSSVDGVGV